METLVSTKTQSWLSWFLKGILALGMIFLLGRLIELQLIKGNYFRSLADENRIKRVTIFAPRGKILARGGEVLVGYKDGKRDYVLGAGFAHVSGYVSEANEDEVGKVDPGCPEKGTRKLGSLVGRDGLESFYDCRLRGIDGERLIEVDTFGKEIRLIGVKEPISGEDIKTNISFNLQKEIPKIVTESKDLPDDPKGAVVVTDGMGEVIAIYSFPSFNPSDLGPSVTDSSLPLFDRATSGAYHPGSTYKIVTSAAALEGRVIDDSFQYDDRGVIKINEGQINEFSYTNWYFTQYGRVEGLVDLKKAIARSTDTFFYKVGEMIGVDNLVSWSQKFGLGQKTGIDLPGEIAGLVPSPKWKEETKKESWFLGNTYHMAIGQGDLTASPLQVNAMTSVIANGGKLCNLKIVGVPECKNLKLSKDTLSEIKLGMIGACSEGGTAYPFFGLNPQVACKTGTAETEEIDKTHAWFVAMTPSDNPELVISVVVEKAGEGSKVAAPLTKEIIQYWNLMNNP